MTDRSRSKPTSGVRNTTNKYLVHSLLSTCSRSLGLECHRLAKLWSLLAWVKIVIPPTKISLTQITLPTQLCTLELVVREIVVQCGMSTLGWARLIMGVDQSSVTDNLWVIPTVLCSSVTLAQLNYISSCNHTCLISHKLVQVSLLKTWPL